MTDQDRRIRDGYARFLESRRFDPVFRKLRPPPRWRYALGLLLVASVAGAGVGLGLIVSAWLSGRKRNRHRRELAEAARRSVPVVAYPIMVNRALLRQEGVTAPGLVLATFDRRLTDAAMVGLVERLALLDLDDLGPGSQSFLMDLFEDEQYTPGRRRRLPDDFTRGAEVYAFDLLILSDYLPAGKLDTPLIPCVAEPGPAGTIQAIPWWVVQEARGAGPGPAGRKRRD